MVAIPTVKNRMIAVPIVEAKNRLTALLHILERNETNAIEITRHGKTVAILGNKLDFNISEQPNPFFVAYSNFRQKINNELSESEWNDYFEIPRPIVAIRHSEDFE